MKGHPAGAHSASGARGFAHPEPIGVTPLEEAVTAAAWNSIAYFPDFTVWYMD